MTTNGPCPPSTRRTYPEPVPSVRSPTAIALAVAGVVLLVYALLTGGAVIAFAVEAFAVTAYLLAPYARGAGEDDDGPDGRRRGRTGPTRSVLRNRAW